MFILHKFSSTQKYYLRWLELLRWLSDQELALCSPLSGSMSGGSRLCPTQFLAWHHHCRRGPPQCFWLSASHSSWTSRKATLKYSVDKGHFPIHFIICSQLSSSFFSPWFLSQVWELQAGPPCLTLFRMCYSSTFLKYLWYNFLISCMILNSEALEEILLKTWKTMNA